MDSGGAKITLDQESFRALASDVRVDILKHLDIRRETLTDLSGLLSLSKPTLLEHLAKLQAAGLVRRIDEGRKWIYYELSDKGRKVLHPERVAITLALVSAVVLASIGLFSILVMAGGAGAPAPFLSERQEAPSIASSPWLGAGVASLLFSLVAGILALGLRSRERRRRNRLFEQLGPA